MPILQSIKLRQKQNNMKHITLLHLLVLIVICSIGIVAISCSDNEQSVPSYIVELVEANSDQSGNIVSIRLDNGTTFSINQYISTNTADSTYRCICTYRKEATGIYLYSLNNVFSQNPRPSNVYKTRPLDPVKLISCWKSDRYLNIKIGVMTGEVDNHAYGFCLDSISNYNDKRIAHFTLLHERPSADTESYTRENFLSMPINRYTDCDSIAISIPTYNGMAQIIR